MIFFSDLALILKALAQGCFLVHCSDLNFDLNIENLLGCIDCCLIFLWKILKKYVQMLYNVL